MVLKHQTRPTGAREEVRGGYLLSVSCVEVPRAGCRGDVSINFAVGGSLAYQKDRRHSGEMQDWLVIVSRKQGRFGKCTSEAPVGLEERRGVRNGPRQAGEGGSKDKCGGSRGVDKRPKLGKEKPEGRPGNAAVH